jgi:cation diffusion facilitator CzcD-associated flavoprotein CzcO
MAQTLNREQPMNITTTHPRARIIGAGSSGAATAKVLHERGIEFDRFELPDQADITGDAPGDVRLF